MAKLPRRPRRTVVFTTELDDALKSLSSATGASYSSLVVDFLSPSIPVINQISEAITLVRNGGATKSQSISSLKNLYSAATRTIRELDDDLVEDFGERYD